MRPSSCCFLGGTQIWTPHGERRVEDLQIGDLVVTSSGEAKPIQWVWGRALSGRAGRNGPKRSPRFGWRHRRLGPNTPHRELFLSRYHCLYLDGVLIPVVDLLNNSTITRCNAEHLQEIEYFHIKLDRHSVIYAEGAACETLQAITAMNSDDVEFEEYRKLYGEPRSPGRARGTHARLQWGAIKAPRADSKRHLARDRCSQQA